MKTFFLTLALAGSLGLSAQTFDVDGIRYKVIDGESGTVSVESKTPAYTGDVVIPATVVNDNTSYTVVALTQSATASTTDGAFANCSGLKSITLPATITSIGNYSFNGCTALPTITIPENVKTFGKGVFQNCTELSTIVMPATAESIGESAFSGCKKLTALSIPEGITEMPNRVLYGLSELTEITLPSTLVTIGNDNFRNCTKVTAITLPEGVISVGQYFASGCTLLDKVELPSTLSSIGKYSFWNSKVVTYISCAATMPPTATDAFYSWTDLYPNCTLYVPEASINAYKVADVWKNFTNIEALLPPPAEIDTEFTVNGVSYIVKENTNRLAVTVTQLDDPDNEEGQYSGNVTVPETVKYEGRDYTVTAIGIGAFYSCKQLTSVILPATIESIGDYAFARCEALTTVDTLPAGLSHIGSRAFIYTAELTSMTVDKDNTCFAAEDDILYSLDSEGKKASVIVCAAKTSGSKTIPEGVTALDYAAFAKCDQIAGISFPSTLETIGEYAFDSCTRISAFSIPDNVTSIGAQAFYKCTNLSDLKLPSNLQSIEEGTFMFCSSLVDLNLPSTITSIGAYTFEGCTGLIELSIPESCTFLGDHAFEECRNLTSVNIPASLTYIDDFAFLNCSNLVSLTLPGEMEAIGYGAFKDCGSLENISMPVNLESLEGYAFGNCVKLTSIVIPDGITSIEDRLFWGCTSLSEIHIPTSVTVIGPFAFDRTPIKEITLHEGVTTIGEDAFQHCKELEVISLPSTVTYIDKYAFWDCTSARMFTSLATVPASAEKAFSASFPTATCTLYVPASAIDSYREAAGWSLFANIEAIPEIGYIFTQNDVTYRVTAINPDGNTVEVVKGNSDYTGDVVIPESVTEYYDYMVNAIGDEALAECGGLISISLPASIMAIGSKAFMNCSGLEEIICLGETPAIAAQDAFEGLDPKNITLTVPDNALDAYRNADVWKEFFTTDGVTGIAADKDSNTTVYDISGRIVSRNCMPTEPGLYIVNGRKVMIK